MDFPEDLSLEDLDAIRIPDERGRVAVRLGLIVTLYMWRMSEPPRRRALGERIRAYLAGNAAHLRWYLPPSGGGHWHALREASPPDVASYLASLPETHGFDFVTHSGEDEDDAGHYKLLAVFFSSLRPRKLGYVSFSLPFSWVARHEPGAFQQEVLRWCRALSPYHGYAGLAVLQNPDYPVSRRAEPYILPLIQRFPGLEYDQPIDHGNQCRDGIKGINWLTIVSQDLLARVGGEAMVREALAGAPVSFDDYPGGVVLQAGPVPQFGDTTRGLIPSTYQRVARVLRPLRAPYNDTLIQTPPGVDDRAFAQQWLGRFD